MIIDTMKELNSVGYISISQFDCFFLFVISTVFKIKFFVSKLVSFVEILIVKTELYNQNRDLV